MRFARAYASSAMSKGRTYCSRRDLRRGARAHVGTGGRARDTEGRCACRRFSLGLKIPQSLLLRADRVIEIGKSAGDASIHLMIDWSTCPAVERDPERVSGAWVFRGTRVPVAALFENLEDGALAAQFVEWFPGVTLEQVRAVLEHAKRSALTPV